MNELHRFLAVDDGIRQFRDRRAALVRTGLESLGLDHATVHGAELADYAMANEVAARLREAVGNGSPADLVAAARQHLLDGTAALTPVGSVKALRCAGLDEDQCMFSEGVTLGVPTAEERDLLGRAVQVLESTGCLSCFQDSVGVVAVLGTVTPGAPVATWATGGLPYVVHLHLMPRAELVARDLIHEATHTYLNDWLAARAVRLDPITPMFWSPWKETKRPLFGFVHSIMAFSVVTAFLTAVMATGGPDADWLRSFRDAERERLRSCAESVAAAVAQLPDELNRRIADVYALAVG